MKPVSELLASKKAKLEHRLAVSNKRPPSPSAEKSPQNGLLSHLERLPTELVQHIFFHCLEVDMIKASPVISKMLSTESTYKLLILFAFFDDDGVHPVETDNFRPVSYRELPVQERIRLQEAILSCRWCSLKRVQDCMRTLTRLKMVQEWHREHNVSKHWPADLATASMKGINPPALPALDDTTALEYYFHVHKQETDAENTTEAEQTEYLPWLRPYTVRLSSDNRLIKHVQKIRPGHRLVFTSTLAVRHIPPKLLTGQPWTPEKLHFLTLLRQGFRHLTRDFILHISVTALFLGMASAITSNNLTALLILLELHDSAFHIKKTGMTSHLANHSHRNQRFITSDAHPLPLSLFHLAIKHPLPTAEPLLSLLIRGGLDSIPKDDALLTKWALTATTSDGAASSIAAFILSYMEGGLGCFNGEEIFRHGSLVAGFLQRFECSSVASFAEEIGYEAPTRNWQFSVVVVEGGAVA
jgi:hypothetical protein